MTWWQWALIAFIVVVLVRVLFAVIVNKRWYCYAHQMTGRGPFSKLRHVVAYARAGSECQSRAEGES